ASAVVVERPVELPPGVARLVVPNGRAAWAWLSAAWYGFPSRQLAVVGVTGTDGKTTTSSLIGAILAAADRRVGLVTTVAALNADDLSYRHLRALPYDRCLSYTLEGEAELTASDVQLDSHGSRFVARTPLGDLPIEARLLGRFNVANALAAIGAAVGLGA